MRAYVKARAGRRPQVIIKDGRAQIEQIGFDGPDGLTEAQEFAAAFNAQEERAQGYDRGKNLKRTGLPIDQVMIAFRKNRVALLSPGHQSHANSKIDQLIQYFGDQDIRSLNDDDIRAYASHQFKTPPAIHYKVKASTQKKLKRLREPKAGRGYWTVVNEISLLRAAINGLIADVNVGLQTNPTPRMVGVVKGVARALQIAPRQIQIWNDDELAAALDLIEEKHRAVYPVAYFASTTGARIGEILALQESDLNLEKGIAAILKTKTRKARNIQIPESVCEFLGEHMGRTRRRLRKIGSNPLVFPSPRGLPWSQRNFDRSMMRARVELEAAGIPAHSMHSFRHTYLSICLREMGYRDIPWVANQAGHSIEVLLKTYAHVMINPRDTSFTDVRAVRRKGKAASVTESSKLGSQR